MNKYIKVDVAMQKIARYPLVHVRKLNDLEYKLELGGQLMVSFMRLGEIQSDVIELVGDDWELRTEYGDGQDAIFRFVEK